MGFAEQPVNFMDFSDHTKRNLDRKGCTFNIMDACNNANRDMDAR